MPSKLPQLDGLRGVAALIVVAWHFVFAFAPAQIGFIAPFDHATGLAGSPAFALINGPAAVILFFVLSGYVLPLAWFRSNRIETVFRAVAKRWFRLVGLTLLAALTSYLLFRSHLYHYREAGALTQSRWLTEFGGGDRGGHLHPSLTAAVLDGAVYAFYRSSDIYDPVMWTMRDELLGSLLTFVLAAAVWRCRPSRGIAFLAFAALATQWFEPRLLAFLAGLGLSWAHARGVPPPGRLLALCCLAAGALLFGYVEPRGFYAPLAFLYRGPGIPYDRVWVQTLSGLLLILGLLGSRWATSLFASAAGRLLGRLSFPIYLFHFLLLSSLTCWLFLWARGSVSYNAALAIAATGSMPVLLVLARLFAGVDEAWLATINSAARHLIRTRPRSESRDAGPAASRLPASPPIPARLPSSRPPEAQRSSADLLPRPTVSAAQASSAQTPVAHTAFAAVRPTSPLSPQPHPRYTPAHGRGAFLDSHRR